MMSEPQVEEAQIQKLKQIFELLQSQLNSFKAEFDTQTKAHQHQQARKQALIKQKDQLIQKTILLLEQIQIERRKKIVHVEKNLKEKIDKNLLQRQRTKQIAQKNQFQCKIPKLNFELSQIQAPLMPSACFQSYKKEYEQEKMAIEHDITKLKIIIRLAQIDSEQIRSKRSQKSNSRK